MASGKTPWIELFDDNYGIPYYYNEDTEETVWEIPPGVQVRKPDDDGDEGSKSTSKNEKEKENENEKGVETNDVAGGEEVEDARKHTQSVQQEKARPMDDIYASVDDEDCPIPSFSRVPASPSSASASPRPKPLTHSNSTFMNFPDFVPANPDDDEDGPPIPFFEDEKRSLPSSPLVSPCSPQPADIDETVEELFGPTSPHGRERPEVKNKKKEEEEEEANANAKGNKIVKLAEMATPISMGSMPVISLPSISSSFTTVPNVPIPTKPLPTLSSSQPLPASALPARKSTSPASLENSVSRPISLGTSSGPSSTSSSSAVAPSKPPFASTSIPTISIPFVMPFPVQKPAIIRPPTSSSSPVSTSVSSNGNASETIVTSPTITGLDLHESGGGEIKLRAKPLKIEVDKRLSLAMENAPLASKLPPTPSRPFATPFSPPAPHRNAPIGPAPVSIPKTLVPAVIMKAPIPAPISSPITSPATSPRGPLPPLSSFISPASPPRLLTTALPPLPSFPAPLSPRFASVEETKDSPESPIKREYPTAQPPSSPRNNAAIYELPVLESSNAKPSPTPARVHSSTYSSPPSPVGTEKSKKKDKKDPKTLRSKFSRSKKSKDDEHMGSSSSSSSSSSEIRIGDDGVMPAALAEDINRFVIRSFTKQFFETQKRGLFRRQVPVKELLTWTRDPIKSSMMRLASDSLVKEALKIFKLIQSYMGDRKTKVDHLKLAQEIVGVAIQQAELRDEVYCQLCKQVTENPNDESRSKGWELIVMSTVYFPPTRDLEGWLREFVGLHGNRNDESRDKMFAQYANKKLDSICKTGPRGRMPTLQELERPRESPFTKNIFNVTLDEIMELQLSFCPERPLPFVLETLTSAIISLRGLSTEGIFRVPGDTEKIHELRIQLERGNYEIPDSIKDPNTPASLLKLWMRELTDPIIPMHLYQDCIDSEGEFDKAMEVVNKLPEINRRVVMYVVAFLQQVARDQEINKMSPSNLAMVFAPNFLRCKSNDPQIIFENTKYEQNWLKALIVNIPPT